MQKMDSEQIRQWKIEMLEQMEVELEQRQKSDLLAMARVAIQVCLSFVLLVFMQVMGMDMLSLFMITVALTGWTLTDAIETSKIRRDPAGKNLESLVLSYTMDNPSQRGVASKLFEERRLQERQLEEWIALEKRRHASSASKRLPYLQA